MDWGLQETPGIRKPGERYDGLSKPRNLDLQLGNFLLGVPDEIFRTRNKDNASDVSRAILCSPRQFFRDGNIVRIWLTFYSLFMLYVIWLD